MKSLMTAPESDADAMLAVFERLALRAGRRIMEIFNAGATVETKADLSPVTEADRAAEKIILQGLRAEFPGIPCVAEEECSEGSTSPDLGEAFFLVDPLDGTREFVKRGSDFTVNIALVRGGVPTIGVVYAPAMGTLYAGRPGKAEAADVGENFAIAARRPIAIRAEGDPPLIVASRSHRTGETNDFIARFPGAETVSVGSSLKFCLLASGKADLYPRFGRTMEWDTAAGDAVLRAAGGMTCTLDGAPLAYGKRDQPEDFGLRQSMVRGGLRPIVFTNCNARSDRLIVHPMA